MKNSSYGELPAPDRLGRARVSARFAQTAIPGVVVVEPHVYRDAPRLLPRDVPGRDLPRGRHRRGVRAGQPLVLEARHAARAARAEPERAGEAPARDRGRGLRRRRGRAARLPDLRAFRHRGALGRQLQADLRAAGPAARLRGDERRGRRSSTSAPRSTGPTPSSAWPGTTPTSRSRGRRRRRSSRPRTPPRRGCATCSTACSTTSRRRSARSPLRLPARRSCPSWR